MNVVLIQFGFMAGRKTTHALLVVRKMQEEYTDNSSICFVDIEQAYDKVSGKVMERAVRKKDTPHVLVRAVINLFYGLLTKVRVV